MKKPIENVTVVQKISNERSFFVMLASVFLMVSEFKTGYYFSFFLIFKLIFLQNYKLKFLQEALSQNYHTCIGRSFSEIVPFDPCVKLLSVREIQKVQLFFSLLRC